MLINQSNPMQIMVTELHRKDNWIIIGSFLCYVVAISEWNWVHKSKVVGILQQN